MDSDITDMHICVSWPALLQQHDLRPAQLGQMIRHRRAHDASSTDDHSSASGQSRGPRVWAGEPQRSVRTSETGPGATEPAGQKNRGQSPDTAGSAAHDCAAAGAHTHRDTHTHTHTEREKERHTQTHTQRHTHTHRERERHTHTERERHTHTHTHTHRDTHTQIHTHKHKHTHTHTQRERDTHTHTHTHTETHTHRYTHTDTHTHTHTHRERERDTHTHTHTHTHVKFLLIVGTFHRLLLLLFWPNNIFYPLTLNLTENQFAFLHFQINIIYSF